MNGGIKSTWQFLGFLPNVLCYKTYLSGKTEGEIFPIFKSQKLAFNYSNAKKTILSQNN